MTWLVPLVSRATEVITNTDRYNRVSFLVLYKDKDTLNVASTENSRMSEMLLVWKDELVHSTARVAGPISKRGRHGCRSKNSRVKQFIRRSPVDMAKRERAHGGCLGVKRR